MDEIIPSVTEDTSPRVVEGRAQEAPTDGASNEDALGELVRDVERGTLPAEVWEWLRAMDKRDLRRALDPEDIPHVVERLQHFAIRAIQLTELCAKFFPPAESELTRLCRAMTPGLEVIARVSQDLRGLVADNKYRTAADVRSVRRGDVRTRHAETLRVLTRTDSTPNAALFVESILEDVANLGLVRDTDEAGAPIEYWAMPEAEARRNIP